jgi:hypothetical protein
LDVPSQYEPDTRHCCHEKQDHGKCIHDGTDKSDLHPMDWLKKRCESENQRGDIRDNEKEKEPLSQFSVDKDQNDEADAHHHSDADLV